MKTQAEWEHVIRCNTMRMTDQQITAIAAHAVQEEAEGRSASVWHSSAAVLGTKCNCAKCLPNVKRYI